MWDIVNGCIDRDIGQLTWWVASPELATVNLGCLAMVGALMMRQYILAACIGVCGLIFLISNAMTLGIGGI
jgi:hypothetical protein